MIGEIIGADEFVAATCSKHDLGEIRRERYDACDVKRYADAAAEIIRDFTRALRLRDFARDEKKRRNENRGELPR